MFLCTVWIVRPSGYKRDDTPIEGIAVDENGNSYDFEPCEPRRHVARDQPRKDGNRKKLFRDKVLINAPDDALLVIGSDSQPEVYNLAGWQTLMDEAAARILGA
jgi:hypothetical protein